MSKGSTTQQPTSQPLSAQSAPRPAETPIVYTPGGQRMTKGGNPPKEDR